MKIGIIENLLLGWMRKFSVSRKVEESFKNGVGVSIEVLKLLAGPLPYWIEKVLYPPNISPRKCLNPNACPVVVGTTVPSCSVPPFAAAKLYQKLSFPSGPLTL